MIDLLTERWDEMWSGIGAQGHAMRYLDEVIARYSQPHRKHHAVPHLSHGFNLIWSMIGVLHDIDLYRVAFAFAGHDIFYDPHLYVPRHGSLCESVSADWTKCVAREIGLPESFCLDMERLIMATAHNARSDNEDERLIADVDLAILGSPPNEYEGYRLGIRQEFGFYREDIFEGGRLSFVKKFLHKDRIFQTDAFYELFEARARENLTCELDLLCP